MEAPHRARPKPPLSKMRKAVVVVVVVLVLARSSDVVMVVLQRSWVIRAKALAVTDWFRSW